MKALTELKVSDLLKESNLSFEDHWELIDSALKVLKKRLIEEALEAERTEFVCCSYRERAPFRKDYRNGYWKRWLLLKDGRLELRMPRLRDTAYESQIVPRYVQRMPEVDDALKRVFLFGVSTRRTGEALRPLLGESLSAQTVSKIAQGLDEEVRRFHTRALADHYVYLFFDAIILKVRTGAGAKKKAVLVAYGITTDGRRELIDFVVTTHESQAAWEGFSRSCLPGGSPVRSRGSSSPTATRVSSAPSIWSIPALPASAAGPTSSGTWRTTSGRKTRTGVLGEPGRSTMPETNGRRSRHTSAGPRPGDPCVRKQFTVSSVISMNSFPSTTPPLR